LYPDQPQKRSGIDVFGIIVHLAYSTVLIAGFGSAGAVIGLVIAFVTMSSEMANYGLIGFLIIMMVGGIGAVVGAAIGIVVAIIIGLISTPNKTKGDYFKIIGIPFFIVLIIVLWISLPIFRDEYQRSQREETPDSPPPVAQPAPPVGGFYITCDDFLEGNHLKRDLHVQTGYVVRIGLCSNPTTRFQWSPTAQISDWTILKQRGEIFLQPPQTDSVGAAGTYEYLQPLPAPRYTEQYAEWTFEALTKGISTVLLENSSPLQGSPVEWSLTATITVN
jgi:hypothetical protein